MLIYIKRLVMARKISITYKAADEMEIEGLTEDDVMESILNARAISKVLRSTSALRSSPREKLYIIKGYNFSNTLIYTKGKLERVEEGYVLYVLISSKRSL